ncbi:MAG TPA: Crp/Fnr family transcriptional regulator [Chitinophaga sp.]|uniref:Crp/Fnr family transcriptional regulator n=1 Tax=Chitinophaga sp. TaxID=1869181 RepID=UPI002BD0B9A8|nr:Crp/Fnr family transcriptional regulator [Chitinophaga sp.]HVI46386.1 Crp/Fnr family transcriptional regulator [Chitinophaga sp.]
MHELLIKNFGKYVSLTADEINKIPAFFVHKKVPRKKLLLEEGSVCQGDYFVIKGCLRQYETDAEGRENVVQFALEDWWISDLYSMFTNTPSVYNIDALEDAEVLFISHANQEALFREIPVMNIYWRIIMQHAFVALQRRVLFLQKPLEERYHDFLQRYAYFEQRIPQHQIASYLGITRESLSRIRGAVLKNK